MKSNCGDYPRTMQRGASFIYFPNTVSSLVIPPYSDRINSLIESSQQFKDILVVLREYDESEVAFFIQKRVDKWAQNIALQKSLNKDVVKNILDNMK